MRVEAAIGGEVRAAVWHHFALQARAFDYAGNGGHESAAAGRRGERDALAEVDADLEGILELDGQDFAERFLVRRCGGGVLWRSCGGVREQTQKALGERGAGGGGG